MNYIRTKEKNNKANPYAFSWKESLIILACIILAIVIPNLIGLP
jgi:hypothetical protein